MRRAFLAAGLALALTGCATRPASTTRATAPAAVSAAGAAAASADLGGIMVASATRMLGQPYRYGGAAPGGFDCSGLVEYAAESAGVHLPRTARDQSQAGVPIARAQLRAGDLVFMHLARKELHVGIAIDGERFIHAPASGGRVRIDSLAAPPYSTGFVGARRVTDTRDAPSGAAGARSAR